MFREIADIYRASKKKKDINWWTEYVCRPPAAVLVWMLRGTRVTPNQITILSALVAVGAGAIFVTLPGHLWLILAAVVYELSFVLDCVDGQLARVKKISSPLGHLFDFLMDEIKAMLIFGCVTVRMWRQTEDDMFLLVGLAALFALASGISMTSFMRRPEYLTRPEAPEAPQAAEAPEGPANADTDTDNQTESAATGESSVQVHRRTGVVGLVVGGLEFVAKTCVHYPAYIWLAAAVDRIDIYFWIYAGVNALYLARTSLVLVLRLGRFEPRKEVT